MIVAAGGQTNFFGLESVARRAIGLKGVEDAVAIRNHILPGFPDDLQHTAAGLLARKLVQVRLNTSVKDFNGAEVTLNDGQCLAAHTLIWAAGVRAAGLIGRLGVPQAKLGRAVVQPTLQLPDHPEVFVIGDAAYLENDGETLPILAPVAIQQACMAAENVSRSLQSLPLVSFVYHDPGERMITPD